MDTRDWVFVASAARTGTTPVVSPVFDASGANFLVVEAVASAKTGTSPTLTVLVEDSLDGTNFYTLGTLTVLTDNGVQMARYAGFGKYARVTATIGGSNTPGYTYAVTGHCKEH